VPQTIAEIADALLADAEALIEEGKEAAAARVAVAAAKAWRGLANAQAAAALSPARTSASLQEMTGAQLERRGKAIAKAKAAKSDDRLWAAIVKSKWGSQEVYAKKRLGVSPGSLSAYRSGNTPCPRPVAAKVLADFDIGDDYWTGGVVD
jgi:hypothetical protein